MTETLADVPRRFTSGDTVKFTHNPGGNARPGDGWAATWSVVSTDTGKDVTGTDNGDGRFLFTFAASANDLAAGRYKWAIRVSKGSEVYTLERGEVDVLNPYAGGSGVDDRTDARKVLEALDSAILTKSADDISEWTIDTAEGQRQVGKMSWRQLLEARKYYAGIVRAEEIADRRRRGLGHHGKIRTRFV